MAWRVRSTDQGLPAVPLTRLGWQVIRFSWYLVMHEPAYIHETLLAAVASATRHANVAVDA